MNNIFDSHAHYNDEQFDIDRDALLASLPEAGIVGILNCGTDVESSIASIEMAEKYPFVYAACGYHPESALEFNEERLSEIEKMLSHEKCVAVGEIGLEYHYDFVQKDVQKYVFEKVDRRLLVQDTDNGKGLLNSIKELETLMFLYESGVIPDKSNK